MNNSGLIPVLARIFFRIFTCRQNFLGKENLSYSQQICLFPYMKPLFLASSQSFTCCGGSLCVYSMKSLSVQDVIGQKLGKCHYNYFHHQQSQPEFSYVLSLCSLSEQAVFVSSFQLKTVTTTEFCQGHTMRWGVAWSFLPDVAVKVCYEILQIDTSYC